MTEMTKEAQELIDAAVAWENGLFTIDSPKRHQELVRTVKAYRQTNDPEVLMMVQTNGRGPTFAIFNEAQARRFSGWPEGALLFQKDRETGRWGPQLTAEQIAALPQDEETMEPRHITPEEIAALDALRALRSAATEHGRVHCGQIVDEFDAAIDAIKAVDS